MDPLSISAAIVALIGAANQVAIGLNKLASLKGASAAILQLNNEVSDLRLILQETEHLLLRHRQAAGPDLATCAATSVDEPLLLLSIDQARNNLMDVESLIQNRLMTRLGVIDKLGWLLDQDKVRKAKENIRKAKLDITAALGVVSSSATFRLEAQLQALSFSSGQGQAFISKSLVSHGDMFEKSFMRLVEAQHEHEQRLAQVETSISANSEKSADLEHSSTSNNQKDSHWRYGGSNPSFLPNDSFSALRMRFLRRSRCDSRCRCRCHKQTRVQTPQMLQSVLGTLFVGYASLPVVTPPCDNERCKGSSEGFLQINYFFPGWFIARIISVTLRFQGNTGPEMSFRILNVRSKNASIFHYASAGDAKAVDMLLTTKKASVLDVTDDTGHSALHLALLWGHVEVIKVLLKWNAFMYLENKTQETPYEMAWTTVYSFEGTSNGSIWRTGEIRALFPNSLSVDEKRKFTRIHKTVLRILHLDLEKQLFHNRSTIDDEDADGKTALSWAAARGDSKSVETLLRYGASPHIPDRIGQGPLRQSIKAHDASCIKLLLAYGAQVDQTDNWRQTALQAAMYYSDPLSFILPLLAAGADVNARDFEGNSPLIEAVAGNHPEAVRVLLAHEAEVNHTNDHGHTPFYMGVQRNSHEALAVLSTAFSIQHALRDKYGNSILHCAAEWADIETLNLLHVARLLGLNIADTNVDGLTAIDVAEKRRLSPQGERNVDSAWVTAFGELLESLARIETPMSATFSVSEGSDDLFVDALQNLTGEELANLAEMGCISRRAETVDEIEKL